MNLNHSEDEFSADSMTRFINTQMTMNMTIMTMMGLSLNEGEYRTGSDLFSSEETV